MSTALCSQMKEALFLALLALLLGKEGFNTNQNTTYDINAIIKLILSTKGFDEPSDQEEHKKLPCYMHDSVCRWHIVENTKMF